VVLLIAAPALANDDDAIDPDRPDVTFSPNTVGKGRVQLETGMFYRRTSQAGAAAERRISAEATLRVGVTETSKYASTASRSSASGTTCATPTSAKSTWG